MNSGSSQSDLKSLDSHAHPVSAEPHRTDSSIAVVIPTFRRPDDLHNLLVSLRSGTRIPDEVIIVDNDPIQSAFPDPVKDLPMRVIHGGFGLCVSAARNLGWRSSHSELCFFVDDDNVVERDTIAELVQAFQNTRDVGLIGPLIFAGDTGAIWCGGIIRSPWTGLTRCLHRSSSEVPSRSQWSTEDMPDAFAVPRTVLLEIDGFDEQLFPFYYEEADIAARIKSLGLQAIVLRDARIRHYGYVGLTSGRAMVRATECHGAVRARQMALSRVRFHSLHTRGLARLSSLALFIPVWMVLTWAECLFVKTSWRVRRTTVGAIGAGALLGYREAWRRLLTHI
jgi:GT2 family glycosyltransferase